MDPERWHWIFREWPLLTRGGDHTQSWSLWWAILSINLTESGIHRHASGWACDDVARFLFLPMSASTLLPPHPSLILEPSFFFSSNMDWRPRPSGVLQTISATLGLWSPLALKWSRYHAPNLSSMWPAIIGHSSLNCINKSNKTPLSHSFILFKSLLGPLSSEPLHWDIFLLLVPFL